MSLLVRITAAAPGDALLHFPSNGEGGFTSLAGTAALAATYTEDGATLTGGASVPGTAGDTGYCFTSSGYYAPYRVVTAGANGVIEVDIWRHGTIAQLGRLPIGTITFHTPSSCLATFLRPVIEAVVVRTAGTGDTITITDAKGTALETIVVPTSVSPVDLDWPCDGKQYQGPFGFILTGGGQLGVDIMFRGGKPTTKASRRNLV